MASRGERAAPPGIRGCPPLGVPGLRDPRGGAAARGPLGGPLLGARARLRQHLLGLHAREASQGWTAASPDTESPEDRAPGVRIGKNAWKLLAVGDGTPHLWEDCTHGLAKANTPGFPILSLRVGLAIEIFGGD